VLYIVYKTTNKINSKYYIGVHQTDNINDGYMGCGHYRGRKLREQLDTKLYRAFRKYGDDAFTTEVLFKFDNDVDAYEKEKELIDITDKNCYNHKPGGVGGFHPETNKGRVFTEEERKKMSKSAKDRSKKYLLQTNVLKEYNKWRTGKTYTEIYGKEKGEAVSFKKSKSLTGRKCSIKHRQKMSENRKGKDCGNCKGRKKVLDITTNKIIRLFPIDIEQLIKEKKIIKETKKVSKFHAVNYIKVS
jgi:hypothetical protein